MDRFCCWKTKYSPLGFCALNYILYEEIEIYVLRAKTVHYMVKTSKNEKHFLSLICFVDATAKINEPEKKWNENQYHRTQNAINKRLSHNREKNLATWNNSKTFYPFVEFTYIHPYILHILSIRNFICGVFRLNSDVNQSLILICAEDYTTVIRVGEFTSICLIILIIIMLSFACALVKCMNVKALMKK